MNIHFNDFNEIRYDTTSGFNSRVIKLRTKDILSNDDSEEKHEEFITKRTFKGDVIERKEDPTGKKTIIYKDFIEFYKLQSGNMIGHRILMPLDIYILHK